MPGDLAPQYVLIYLATSTAGRTAAILAGTYIHQKWCGTAKRKPLLSTWCISKLQPDLVCLGHRLVNPYSLMTTLRVFLTTQLQQQMSCDQKHLCETRSLPVATGTAKLNMARTSCDSCDSDSCFMLHRRNPRTGPKTVIWLRETCHDRRCGMKPLCY